MARATATRPKPTKADRELMLLLSVEDAMDRLLRDFARPTQSYDFLRETLSRVRDERTVLQMAREGDPHAQRLRTRGRRVEV